MKRYMALLLAFVMMVTLLSGCIVPVDEENDVLPTDPEDALELIIILGLHENAWLSLDDLVDGKDAEEFAELIARTVHYEEKGEQFKAEYYVKVLVCDGNPSLVTLQGNNGKPLELAVTARRATALDGYTVEMAKKIAQALQRENMIADDDEVDLVKALKAASNMFETDREHMIYILDTGMCTMGALNLQELDLGTNITVADIQMNMQPGDYADLSGIHVEFRNLGDVCGKQENVCVTDTTVKNKLEAMWDMYLTECGAASSKVVFNGNEYNESEDKEKYQAYNFTKHVTGIKFSKPDLTPIRGENEKFDALADADLILNDASVDGYDKNDHTPNNVEKAKQIAAEKKEMLDRILTVHPDCVFYVVGSSSLRKGKYYDKDSDAAGRATTFAKYLIEAGVPADQIVIIDAGSNELPWRNTEEKNDEDKKKNQVVAIIPSYRVELVNILDNLPGDLEDRIVPLSFATT